MENQIIILFLGSIVGVFNISGLISIIIFTINYRKDIKEYEQRISELEQQCRYLYKTRATQCFYNSEGRRVINAEELEKALGNSDPFNENAGIAKRS